MAEKGEGIETYSFQTTEYAQSLGEKGVVNFRLGQPGPKLLSLAHFTKAFEDSFLSRERSPNLLSYSDAKGHADFRQSLATWLSRRYGCDISPEEILMTNGNTHATDFAIRLIVEHYVATVSASEKRGSRQCAYLAVDDPTYFLAGGIFRRYVKMVNFSGQAKAEVDAAGKQPLLTLRMCMVDENRGFDVDGLESWLEEIHARGQKLLALYIIPVYHNPTGTSVTKESAMKLVRLAHRFDFYVLSDEPYPFLNFTGPNKDVERVLSLGAVEAVFLSNASAPSVEPGPFGVKRVIAMGSFSKIFAPGLRLGWIHADAALIDNCFVADPILDSGGGVNPAVGVVIRSMLEGCNTTPQPSYSLDNYLANLVPELTKKCAALVGALHHRFKVAGDGSGSDAEISFHAPEGGYFMWVRFLTASPGFSGADLNDFVVRNKAKYKVSFLAGNRCRAAPGTVPEEEVANQKDNFSHCIRLSFAFYDAPELEEGVRRLRLGYDDYIESLTNAKSD